MPSPVDNNITGRLCLVVGASGGIGRAVAKDLYAKSVPLALTYLNNEEGIENLVSELDDLWASSHPPPPIRQVSALRPSASSSNLHPLLSGSRPSSRPSSPSPLLRSSASSVNGDAPERPEPISPPKISIHQADVSSREDLVRVMAEIGDYHGTHPDMLVSCASYHPPDRPKILDELDCVIRTVDGNNNNKDDADTETTAAISRSLSESTLSSEHEAHSKQLCEWKEVMSINLRSNFILTRLCLPHMLTQKWGRIVFITGGEHESIHYQSSKAGLAGFMRHLSNRIICDGVTANSVSPVFIKETGMIPASTTDSQIAEFERSIPVGRLGTPSEVANVVRMFLTTGFMTGQSVVLAGGIRYVG